MRRVLLVLVLIVGLLSGCATKQTPITVLEQGFDKYIFSNDIRDALKVNANASEIRSVFAGQKKMNIVFNGVSPNDNGYFRVVIFNFLNKIRTYLQNNDFDIPKIEPYYYLDGESGSWFNLNNENISRPVFENPTIWLKGPNTGANETGIKRDNAVVYLTGNNAKNLTLAGERLTLLLMGIDSIDDISKNGFKVIG